LVKVSTRDFGITEDGQACRLFTLENSQGANVSIIDFGASLVEFNCLDKDGNLGDIALGYSALAPYEQQRIYLGAAVGRFANRIGNARFTIDGERHSLAANQGDNILHGGDASFAYKVWKLEMLDTSLGHPRLILSHFSPEGEAGFPGNLTTKITFELLNDGCLRLSLHADADKKTPVSLTYHPYFNLSNQAKSEHAGALDDHTFQIFSDKITAVDKELVPTGEFNRVDDTLFDLCKAKSISADLSPLHPTLEPSAGFDHNYCFEPWQAANPPLRLQARALSTTSGRVLDVHSTLPGLQFYSGNHMDGAGFVRYNAFCLEPQFYPDSPNKPEFPFQWTGPEQPYHHIIEWRVYSQT